MGGLPRDQARAAQYLQDASNRGHNPATGKLGNLYMRGEGVVKNHTKAVELYHEVALP